MLPLPGFKAAISSRCFGKKTTTNISLEKVQDQERKKKKSTSGSAFSISYFMFTLENGELQAMADSQKNPRR